MNTIYARELGAAEARHVVRAAYEIRKIESPLGLESVLALTWKELVKKKV